MTFIADFHIHSKYSRATARNLDLENLYINAQIKGITVLGTGDFTHPAWWQEIRDKLVPAEQGLFQLKPEIATVCDAAVPPVCRGPVRFMLATEISNIYKKQDRTRKNHNLVFMPDLDTAEQFNRRLDEIGNIKSDGRPILGLDARNLLEIVLETSDQGFLVPAHIWTPWFSLLGSKSGFDTVDACFEDLTPHIFALETGLSSDPPMNRRVSQLDRYTLISNSDAHSPSKLGREANCFNSDLSYHAMRKAMETGDPDQFLGTLEFYPEEGKYHVDGHRKCGYRSEPSQTRDLEGICPVCGKPLTLGVLYRVEALADRDNPSSVGRQSPFQSLIPLADLLSEVLDVGVNTKTVANAYQRLIQDHGAEFDILCNASRESLEKSNIPLLAEAVIRMREGRVFFNPGYDGEFGKVQIFNPTERDSLQGQQPLFDLSDTSIFNAGSNSGSSTQKTVSQSSEQRAVKKQPGEGKKNDAGQAPLPLFTEPQSSGFHLNAEQQSVVDHENGPLLISAGPGTGKTRTITCKISSLLKNKGLPASRILAVTFTNKAAREMARRLETLLPSGTELPTVATFHGFCWQLLQERYGGEPGAIIDESGRIANMEDAVEMARRAGRTIDLSTDRAIDLIVNAKQRLIGPSDNLSPVLEDADPYQFSEVYACYQNLLKLQRLFDFEDLLFKVVKALEQDESWRLRLQKRFRHIFVDEFQDINDAQYRLLRYLAPSKAHVCVIGDPDQAIYGFRGSDVRYFTQFTKEYANTRIVQLKRNYRCTETILAASFQVIKDHQIKLLGQDQCRTFSNIKHGIKHISLIKAASAKSEAVAIGRTIEQMVGGTGFHSVDFEKLDPYEDKIEYGFGDFAILCRTSDQVQTIARQLISAGIPCQTVSRRVLEQPTVAKLLACFRVVTDQGAYADANLLTDLIAPGISKETLGIFKQWAYDRQLTLATALYSAHRLPIPHMSAARQKRLVNLVKLLQRLQKACEDLTVADTLNCIVAETTLTAKVDPADMDRLTSMARPFGKEKGAFGTAMAIDRDTDVYLPEVERISVMTLHASKGLEFPVVFVAGCESGIIPYTRPGKADIDLEEERRLLYVGMTRAERQLFLTWAAKRTIFGQTQQQQLSPFIADIEKELIVHIKSPGGPPKPRQEQISLF